MIGEVAGVGTVQDADRAHRQAGRRADLDCRKAALEYAGLIPVDGRFELPHPTGDQAMVNDPVTWNLSLDVVDRWVLPS